jgi:hypothetical protein
LYSQLNTDMMTIVQAIMLQMIQTISRMPPIKADWHFVGNG